MSEDEKDGKSDKSDKPLLISRFIAYILDVMIVLLLASFLSAPFVDSDKMLSLSEDSRVLNNKYVEKTITDQEYLVEASNLEYQMAKSIELVLIIYILISILYYVVLPIFNNGQTLGKKLLKMKIVSTYEDLNVNQLIFRSFIADFILLDIIMVLFSMFASRDVFLSCVELFVFAQYIVVITSMIMMIFDKEGLAVHDRLVRTKVIKIN